MEAWKNLTLSAFVAAEKQRDPNWTAPLSLMNSIPTSWTIECVRNASSLEDTYDIAEGLFAAVPLPDDKQQQQQQQQHQQKTETRLDADERENLSRLLTDKEFFESDRGRAIFTNLVLGKRLQACRDHVFVGKSDAALIQLEHPSVSRIHCVVFLGVLPHQQQQQQKQQDQSNDVPAGPTCSCFVVDLGSSNGTILQRPRREGESAAACTTMLEPGKPHLVEDGATIRCGASSVALTARCPSWSERFPKSKNHAQLVDPVREAQRRQRAENADKVQAAAVRDALRGGGGNNGNDNDDGSGGDLFADVAKARMDASRNLSLETLNNRQRMIESELNKPNSGVAAVGEQSSNNNKAQQQQQLLRKASLEQDLREIKFVIMEKQQRLLAGAAGQQKKVLVKQTVVVQE